MFDVLNVRIFLIVGPTSALDQTVFREFRPNTQNVEYSPSCMVYPKTLFVPQNM